MPSFDFCSLLTEVEGDIMMASSKGNIFRVTGHLCGNSQVPGEFPAQRPVTRSFDVFFDLRLNKRLSKQWWGWWFETLWRPLWCHRNDRNGFVHLSITYHSFVVCFCASLDNPLWHQSQTWIHTLWYSQAWITFGPALLNFPFCWLLLCWAARLLTNGWSDWGHIWWAKLLQASQGLINF